MQPVTAGAAETPAAEPVATYSVEEWFRLERLRQLVQHGRLGGPQDDALRLQWGPLAWRIRKLGDKEG